MTFRSLIAQVQFTFFELIALVRCAVRTECNPVEQSVQFLQLETRTLYSAAPIAIEAIEEPETTLSADASLLSELETHGELATSESIEPSTPPLERARSESGPVRRNFFGDF